MRFEFATATRIVFGPGSVNAAGRLIAEVAPGALQAGMHALVVTGRDVGRAEPVIAQLRQHGCGVSTLAVTGEPTVDDARRGARLAREMRTAVVIGMGGGSVVDAAKAVAALATNQGDVFDYLEVIGRGKPLVEPGLPFIAIPTTAGTGSEVTRNAVLGSSEHQVKVSLRSPHMLARLALVDPELTHSMPPAVTAATGLDALTQLIEPFVCSRANAMVDGICREGIARAARSLRRACADGADAAAREDMSLAALFGGLALANAGLGAVHGFAGPIGGMFAQAPHGAVCAALLPLVMRANIEALRIKAEGGAVLARYDEVARLLTGHADARVDDGVTWASDLVRDLRVPRLAAYGLCAEHVDAVVAKAQAASSMKANPIQLNADELKRVLLAAM